MAPVLECFFSLPQSWDFERFIPLAQTELSRNCFVLEWFLIVLQWKGISPWVLSFLVHMLVAGSYLGFSIILFLPAYCCTWGHWLHFLILKWKLKGATSALWILNLNICRLTTNCMDHRFHTDLFVGLTNSDGFLRSTLLPLSNMVHVCCFVNWIILWHNQNDHVILGYFISDDFVLISTYITVVICVLWMSCEATTCYCQI